MSDVKRFIVDGEFAEWDDGRSVMVAVTNKGDFAVKMVNLEGKVTEFLLSPEAGCALGFLLNKYYQRVLEVKDSFDPAQ